MMPFFLPGSAGQLFALYIPAQHDVAPRPALLYFPPFAEEMNKSRRMAVQQARALAAQGHAVLIIDLYGTGDSAGDFAEARWDLWQQDMQLAAAWLRQQGHDQLILWGLRLGACLAMETAAALKAHVQSILLWQPVVRGAVFMTQFLRLRLAAEFISAGDKITTNDLRAALKQGQSVEVAGYTLNPHLVQSVDEVDLQGLAYAGMPAIAWLEVLPSAERTLSPASLQVIEAWRQRGVQVDVHTVVGEPFWSTPEISMVPALLDKSVQLLQAPSP